MSYEDWELLELDRELRRAARRWVRWRRALRSGAGFDEEPFSDFPFVSRLGFEHFTARPESDPLRAPALRWLYRLVDQKACRRELAETERSRRAIRFAIERPERAELTLAELVSRALSDRKRARDWWALVTTHGRSHAERARELWERRADVASRLALAGPDDFAAPCPTVHAKAEEWLASTRDAASEQRVGSLSEWAELALGLDASEGWPGRLSARSLWDLLGETPLLSGYRIDAGRWPTGLGAASWLRALARLGAAFVDAAAPARLPFVLAHDPFGLRRRSVGALLALLPSNPVFLLRTLGVGRSRVGDQRRALCRVMLLESRAAAFRVLLRPHALGGARAHAEAFEALTSELLGAPLPRELAGAVFRLHIDDAQRFTGLLLASSLSARLTEDHDEDWYRNPRAADELRAIMEQAPELTAAPAALDEGAKVARDSLFAGLG